MLRVEALTNVENWGGWRRIEAPLKPNCLPSLSENFSSVLEKLALIECKTGVTFTLTDEGIGEEDWELIHFAAQVLERGRITSTLARETQTLSGPREADAGHTIAKALFESFQRGERISYDGNVAAIQSEILGVEVPLGPMRMHVHGELDPECARELEVLAAQGESPQRLSLRLLNVHRIEEYADWLTPPPQLELIEDGIDKDQQNPAR